MMWILVGICFYLALGIYVALTQGKQLIIEATGDYYDSKDLARFKAFLSTMLVLSVLVWPIVLTRGEKRKSQRRYVISQCSERFSKVAKERGEDLDAAALANISSKFIIVYEEFGMKFYKEHLKYELDKFRKEGLREDYRGRAEQHR